MNNEKYKEFAEIVSVKERLHDNIQFWHLIGANEYILDVINYGYKLPFRNLPNSVILKNNKSSLNNAEFVLQAITELLDCGAVIESCQPPLS